MKFSDRSAKERTAISAWIRVTLAAREDAMMWVPEDFKAAREKSISESDSGIGDMLRHYALYQDGRHSVSYAQYFQVSQPEAYAALLQAEKTADALLPAHWPVRTPAKVKPAV